MVVLWFDMASSPPELGPLDVTCLNLGPHIRLVGAVANLQYEVQLGIRPLVEESVHELCYVLLVHDLP